MDAIHWAIHKYGERNKQLLRTPSPPRGVDVAPGTIPPFHYLFLLFTIYYLLFII
jgi:hypothetical protein